MFQGDFRRVFHLLRGAAQHLAQAGRRHGCRRPDLALAAHLRAGDARVFLDEHADCPRGQQEFAYPVRGEWGPKVPHVVHHRRYHPGGPIGGRGHYPAASRVFLVHRQGKQVHPFHRGQCIPRVAELGGQEPLVQSGRPAGHLQPAREHAGGVNAGGHAPLHGLPYRVYVSNVCFIGAVDDGFVCRHDVGNAHVVGPALGQ